ncbi:MAG TPA: hypothetical protein VHS31_14220, partial [Tepidisphaeraceae bacterium]|nr:hypothetical protein [Tepidisphaeraceae bacterium]
MRPHFVDQSISLQSKNSKRHRKALAAVIQSAIECLEPRTLLTSIISGQTIAGAIAAQGNTAAYSFSAAVNDSFEVSLGDANSASAFEPLMHIFDPQGNEINASASHGTTNTNTSVRQFYQVPSGSGGNYTILVEDDTGTHTGAYDLELAIAPATQASDADGDGGTIATGQTKTGTINRTGDLDIFTFSAAQNNTFEVSLGDPNATSAFEPLMLIYDPHGDEINASASHGTDNTDTSVRQFFQVPTG